MTTEGEGGRGQQASQESGKSGQWGILSLAASAEWNIRTEGRGGSSSGRGVDLPVLASESSIFKLLESLDQSTLEAAPQRLSRLRVRCEGGRAKGAPIPITGSLIDTA